MRIEPEQIITSPKERALRTATLALEEWGGGQAERLRVHQPLSAGFDAPAALTALAALEPEGRLLAVGHEPDLSQIVTELTGARIDLKKAGLAVVRIAAGLADAGRSSDAAGGELLLLLRPVELALIAGVRDADL